MDRENGGGETSCRQMLWCGVMRREEKWEKC